MVREKNCSFGCWRLNFLLSGEQGLMSQICFMGDVVLNGFQLGGYSSSSRTSIIRILDAGTGMVLFSNLNVVVPSTMSLRISGPWASSVGVCMQLGPVIWIVFFFLSFFISQKKQQTGHLLCWSRQH